MKNNTPKQPLSEKKGKEINTVVQEKGSNSNMLLLILAVSLIVLAGIGTGYVLAGTTATGEKLITAETGTQMVKTDKMVGSLDQTFKDEAQGKLTKGGMDGEGTHHLVRDGGPSQYVYLTSSVIDLDQFVDKEVKVWGETFAAQKAGWLMDVGKLELLE